MEEAPQKGKELYSVRANGMNELMLLYMALVIILYSFFLH
jgi:hypothetical protein